MSLAPASPLASPLLAGALFVLSSSLLTTYTTTSFLSHPGVRGSSLPAPGAKSPLSPPSPLSPLSSPLSSLGRPLLITLYRYAGSLLLSLLSLSPRASPARLSGTLPPLFVPALSLFGANLFNNFSLAEMGISNTYTTKCLIPVLTLLLSLLAPSSDPLPPFPALLSLLPVSLGVFLSSSTSPSFSRRGFLFALLSCLGQVSLNVSSKRAMRLSSLLPAGPIGGLECQLNLVLLGLLFALLKAAHSLVSQAPPAPRPPPPPSLGAAAAAAYHVEYSLSFLYLSLVSPLTFSVTDAVRRLAIILAGQAFFPGKEARLGKENAAGMLLALGGVLSYSFFSRAKGQ
ncbi:hypothetical protein TeGR_g11551 [Tetraparma gracilis]|uniref:Sugar phosphate transporter domain-containing protein n=1 Tax=Tetraparma gracilis TaxID=2962635 RepID=A0ABQ6MTW4_9STRA|nr:hypothetical protein TeGR_g11551 [Tetraparma gracilis]